MPTEKEREVLALLKGGYQLDETKRSAIINELDAEGRAALRRIATGELAVEHTKLRGKAVIALGFDESDKGESLKTLHQLLAEPEAALQIRALRALGRLAPADRTVKTATRALLTNPATRPDVALAAARVAVVGGGKRIVADLAGLRERLLQLVGDERSPSIQSLDRLIAQARGEITPVAGEEPKLDI